MYRNPDLPRKKYIYFYIYVVTNIINKKQYVGQHASNDKNDDYLGSGKILEKAIKKYSIENFKKEILQYCDYEIELDTCEEYWIKKLNTKVPNGYNLTDGGEGGRGMIISLESRKKISKSKKGKPTWNKGLKNPYSQKTIEKMSISQKNRPPASLETRKKLSKANTGKIHSEETNLKCAIPKLGDLNPAKRPEVKENISKQLKGIFKGEKNPMAKTSRKRDNLNKLKEQGIQLKGDTHEYLRRKIKCTNIETQELNLFDGVQELLKTLKINKRKYYAHLKNKKPILNKFICEVVNI
jgi:group I intron endonuclease